MDSVYPPIPNPDFTEIDALVRLHLQRRNTIFGSYIYKRLLRNQMPNDLDTIGVKIETDTEVETDHYRHQAVLDFISRKLTFINALVLTQAGLQPAPIASRRQAEFVVKNLQAGRYCPWGDMRPKDHQFFGDLEEIPAAECELHGFFANAVAISDSPRYRTRKQRRPEAWKRP